MEALIPFVLGSSDVLSVKQLGSNPDPCRLMMTSAQIACWRVLDVTTTACLVGGNYIIIKCQSSHIFVL
jgi:hypothetical protein